MEDTQLCLLSAREMCAMVRRRQVSATELLEAHLMRTARYNASVNAIVTIVEDQAREQARRADDKTLSGEPLGVLHGIPMAHKDTHRTKGIRTTFGSPLFVDNVPTSNDLIIDRLGAAGVVSFGKTNTPEFAAGSHTFNTVFGATRNPFDRTRSAGGSSGGAAVALALGLHPLADGSDMGASVRNPASFCNVVGLRPSFGRVPSIPGAVPDERLSVPGVLARSVADVALMMQAVAGPDPRVPYSLPEPGEVFSGVSASRGARLRVSWAPDLGGIFGVDPEVREALTACPAIFERLGWELVEDLPDLSGADETFRTLRAAHFARAYGAIVDRHPEMVKESIRWNVEIGRALTEADVASARENQSAIIERMRTFFSRVDLLGLVTSQVAPFPIELEYPHSVAGELTDDYLGWMASCYLISVTHLPAISVPAGFTAAGLPVGMQLVGGPHGDIALLDAALAFEEAADMNRLPSDPHTVTSGPA